MLHKQVHLHTQQLAWIFSFNLFKYAKLQLLRYFLPANKTMTNKANRAHAMKISWCLQFEWAWNLKEIVHDVFDPVFC
jgi:hypothetical protein